MDIFGIKPWIMMVTAAVLLLLGFLLPLFMILGHIKSTFFLNFLSYTLSILGLFIGIIASVMVVLRSRKRK